MSRGLWLAHLAKNYTEEELAAMENHEPMTIAELENVERSARSVLAQRKLKNAVCGNAEDRETAWRTWCLQKILETAVSISDDDLRMEYEKARRAMITGTLPTTE